MKIVNREYKLLDFIKIPLLVSPSTVSLQIIDKIITALIPSLQVLATAAFIETAIGIFNDQSQRSQIIMPLIWLLLLISYQYATVALMGLVRVKTDMKMTETFRAAVVEKRTLIEYRHVENNETWDLIERVGKDPAERLAGGFNSLLRMSDMIIRMGSLLMLLVVQVWWAALVIFVFSAPLFVLAVKSGKINYKASQEAAKYTRRAGYLQGVLTSRDNVEERALFAYTSEINKHYYQKYDAAYKVKFKSESIRFVKMKSASLVTVVIAMVIAGVLIAPLDSGEISAGMFIGLVTAVIGLTHLISWIMTGITSELASSREYLRDLTAFAKLSETPDAAELHCLKSQY